MVAASASKEMVNGGVENFTVMRLVWRRELIWSVKMSVLFGGYFAFVQSRFYELFWK